MRPNYDAMSEAEKIEIVTQEPWVIEDINNPYEAVCMAAVNQAARTIQHIENPSEAVCMAAVRKDGLAIAYIGNPSEIIQIEAVKQDHRAVIFVLRPIADTVAVIQLVYHPLSPKTPKDILDRAPEILDEYCSGLGDVYTIGLSIGMSGEDLSRTLIEWIESHKDRVFDAEMAP